MDPEKNSSLKNAHQAFMDLMLKDFPLDRMPEYISGDVMGYGTTLHEKLFGMEALADLIRAQREQGQGLRMNWEIEPVHRWVAGHENNAVFVDEVKLTIKSEDRKIELNLRLTLVFDYRQGTWKIIHWHGSKPEYDEGGNDTWHKNEWKKKNEELQRLVEEKTAALEQKNRELEIESALERVRSIAMGMRNAEHLLDVCKTISDQLELLKINDIRNVQVAIVDEPGKNYLNYQYFTPYSRKVYEVTDYENHPASQGMVTEMQKSANSFFIGSMKDEELENFRNWRRNDNQFPDPLLDRSSAIYYYFYSIGEGGLGLTTYREISSESLEIFKRFHNVFTLAYRRFQDIRQAEAQAREAQVEAALEKVRSRSMAMHKSAELADLSFELVKQVGALGIDTWFCAFNIYDDDPLGSLEWGSNNQGTYQEYRTPREGIFLRYYEAGQRGETLLINEIDENECPGHYEYLCSLPGVGEQLLAMKDAGISFPTSQIDHVAYFKYGYIIFITFIPVPEAHEIFKRFAKVFEQSFTRFLDLKKAEAQAREAQVELALERIRAMVANMQNSEELLGIMVKMRAEFVSLGHEAHYFWHMKWMPDKYLKAMTSGDGTQIGMVMELPRKIHGEIPSLSAWEKSDEPTVVHVMDVEATLDYVSKMVQWGDFKLVDPNMPTEQDIHQIGGLTYVMARTLHGEIGYSLPGMVPDPPEEDLATLVRFAAVFDLAYRRFEDLKSAEARTKEALKQASLDRVRAQVASMRKPEDLKSITPLIWRELNTLQVPFFRCGVFIINEKEENVHVYLTTPDGNPLAALHFAFDANDLTKNAVDRWRKNEVYQEHWDRKKFIAWTNEMVKIRQVKTAEDYQGDPAPPESLHLHFIPFAQGMLYVGNTMELEEEMIHLVRSLADAFSYAYARYEDFIVLEDAKQRIEKALNDLKATQSQLVHAEKMASLGELTAGIAHEIQNPLNFVNNFSEVSIELMEELAQETAVSNQQSAVEIMVDIRQNLEKINHHGKRASGIVKSMLEHSRAGSGDKVPTDINTLADEYLRLSYHGLRAKDKSFNADFKLIADPDLPNVNVVPQDIGRVLLNLINNAFYAVSAKALATADNSYKPTVIVKINRQSTIDNRQSTIHPLSLSGDMGVPGAIEIQVIDNGEGIPEEIKEKIFQPFFTTKPAGEGTGLGLSMSYDIITKGHGGELKVETKEGEGTEFIIVIPLT